MSIGLIRTRVIGKGIFGWGLMVTAICFLALSAAGCDSDDGEDADEGRVRVCNSDDVAYGVEVVDRGNDEVVDNFRVEAGLTADATCEESGAIEVGTHYVRFYTVDGEFLARSSNFLITEEDEADTATVYMTQSGEIGVIDAEVEGEGDILVCNLDDEDYIVELRAEADGDLIDSFGVEEALEVVDICDEFTDVPAGVYYLRIVEEDNRNNTDRSVTFFLEDDELQRFEIDSTGSILKTSD
jgi:hypothetical protein